jgi:uncharacterized membrane protein YfcA
MTVKQKALLQTAGILAIIVGGSLGINLILQNLTAEQIINGFAILSIALLIYSMYGVVLSRLEYEETLNKLVDKK